MFSIYSVSFAVVLLVFLVTSCLMYFPTSLVTFVSNIFRHQRVTLLSVMRRGEPLAHNAYNMGVSWNGGTPKSSILMEFSPINQPFGGSPFMETHTSWNQNREPPSHSQLHLHWQSCNRPPVGCSQLSLLLTSWALPLQAHQVAEPGGGMIHSGRNDPVVQVRCAADGDFSAKVSRSKADALGIFWETSRKTPMSWNGVHSADNMAMNSDSEPKTPPLDPETKPVGLWDMEDSWEQWANVKSPEFYMFTPPRNRQAMDSFRSVFKFSDVCRMCFQGDLGGSEFSTAQVSGKILIFTPQELCQFHAKVCVICVDTVDGRNPAPPCMVETLLNSWINNLSISQWGAGFLPSTVGCLFSSVCVVHK